MLVAAVHGGYSELCLGDGAALGSVLCAMQEHQYIRILPGGAKKAIITAVFTTTVSYAKLPL